jgi:hypothetical protein
LRNRSRLELLYPHSLQGIPPPTPLTKIFWPENFTPGPINFGRASWYINVWACSWTAFLSIIFLFPTYRPVTVLNMNCTSPVRRANVDAVVVLAGVGLFAFVWWWAGARHYCISFLDVVDYRYWTENEYSCHCGGDSIW